MFEAIDRSRRRRIWAVSVFSELAEVFGDEDVELGLRGDRGLGEGAAAGVEGRDAGSLGQGDAPTESLGGTKSARVERVSALVQERNLRT
jgi:hypothetical protein